MRKLIVLIFLTLVSSLANSQNIYSALHLNEERDYKTKRPKRIVETNTFYNSSGKQVDRNVKIFDQAGMLLTEERHDESEKLKARFANTNDTINRFILARTFESWSQLGYRKETTVYTYDSTKSLVQVTDKNENGSVIRLSKIVCNDKKLPIELTLFDGNGNSYGMETATYLYDKNKVVTSVFSNNGKILSTDTIKISFENASQFPNDKEIYNSNGDLVNWVSKNLNGTKTIYAEEYFYDNFGNCTENKIYKVTVKGNGTQKRQIDRIFRKEYSY